MTERLDALCVRESNGKSYWTRIGVAFPAKQGSGWTVMLDAMPAPTDGQFKIMLREPKPRDDQQQGRSGGGGGQNWTGGEDLDDQVPFARWDDTPGRQVL